MPAPGSDIAVQDPRMELVAEIRSDRVREQILAALPEGSSIERFERATATAILTNPQLATADRLTFLQALVRFAHMDFLPDGRQGALIVDKNGKVQARDMVAGWRDRCAAHGWALRAQAVREGDDFEYTDEPPEIMHRKARPGTPRGEIVAAYAVAVHRDGLRREQAVLFAEDISKRRAKAQTQSVWNEWPDEQSAKTAAKYLAKRLGLADADKRVPRTLEQDDPIAALYGPVKDISEFRELVPAGAGTDGSQPAGGVGAQEPSSPTSPAAGDEPLWDVDETLAEPGGLARPQGSEGVANDRLSSPGSANVSEVEADAAAMFVPLTGKYAVGGKEGPKTLAQILAVNPGWIVWALSNISEPAEYQRAVWTFARTYARDAFQQALAQREVSA